MRPNNPRLHQLPRGETYPLQETIAVVAAGSLEQLIEAVAARIATLQGST
jgi:hypothetical protein